MFVSAQALVDLGFPAALAGLTDLARGGLLTGVSHGAYGDGLTGLARVGPLDEVQLTNCPHAMGQPGASRGEGR